ncbi:hypothetical protein BDM02DRAFT_3264476 [Thelephora ganbajun]|uniref:Uncharacterized protein n=1 Tax=Thelephora ganbajun TaxID=370292 RepID=A0ACB6YZV5_THEGA|nr:hypothetical protein BDM02DRAFT_3264476 [Thelephora ganbajun]
MKLYETSTVTLRTMLSHPSLQRDKIDETMEALDSVTEDTKNIKIIDDDEIEGEFRALVKNVEEEKRVTEEREAPEELKQLKERLEEVKAPTGVPEAQPESAGPVKEDVHA